MIHVFAKNYGWGKKQCDEIYPEEAVVLLRFIASDSKDTYMSKRMEYYLSCIDKLQIQYAAHPEQIFDKFKASIEHIQGSKVTTLNSYNPDTDDLPDVERMNKLKSFVQNHQVR